MAVGHLLCDHGVSGDLILGTLLDAGVPLGVVRDAVDGLGLPGVSVDAERTPTPVVATRAIVRVPDSPRLENLETVTRAVVGAGLDASVRDRALATMRALLEAEADVHGVAVESVHLHELGSLDTIVDVVAVSAGLAWLGLEGLTHGVVNVGGGTVASDHGVLSVPPPAVTHLLQDRSIEARGHRELTTPTGAAVLNVQASPADELPPMRLRASARGSVLPSGSVLTLLIGDPLEPAPGMTRAVLLEATMDDLEPQVLPAALDALRTLGALDAWASPVQMKKGRAGVTVTVLCPAELLTSMQQALFRHTSTIGLRWHTVQRLELERDWRSVEVAGCDVRIKRAVLAGEVLNAHPEFDDVLAAARVAERPVREVYLEALRCAAAMTGDSADEAG